MRPSGSSSQAVPSDIAALVRLAAEAGRLIVSLASGGLEVRNKEDLSPVTNADVRAEEMLLEGLRRILPGIPVLAEESASQGSMPEVDGTFLVLDPLDGTREFVSGRAEYTVNIALVDGGRPVLGVVHAPALGRTYWGQIGQGASRALHKPATLPAPEMFSAIRTRMPAAALVALTSRGHNDAATEAYLDELGSTDRRRLGSALKFALVAEGSGDLYPRFGNTMEWDTAAGDALLTAAGGIVLTPDGDLLRYGKTEDGFRNGPFIAWGQAPG